MKEILAAVLDHFTDFTWKRFRAFMLVIILILLALFGFDSYTSFFSMNRLSRAADLISKIQTIESSGHTRSPELESAYSALREQVADQVASKPWTVRISAPNVDVPYSIWWKFLAGLAPWMMLSIVAIPDTIRRKVGAGSAFIASHIVGICFGLICMIVPTYAWPWFNLIFVPIGIFVIVLSGIVYAAMKQFKKERKNQEVSHAG